MTGTYGPFPPAPWNQHPLSEQELRDDTTPLVHMICREIDVSPPPSPSHDYPDPCNGYATERKTTDLKMQAYQQSIDLPFLSGEGTKKCNAVIGKLTDPHAKTEAMEKIKQAFEQIKSNVDRHIDQQKFNNTNNTISADKLTQLKKLFFYAEATIAAYHLHFLSQKMLLEGLRSATEALSCGIYKWHCQQSAGLSAAVQALNYKDLAINALLVYDRPLQAKKASVLFCHLVNLQFKKKEFDAEIHQYLRVKPYYFSKLLEIQDEPEEKIDEPK